VSADRHGSLQELAVLSRVNHDMRSPLSVILGVFELLDDDASSLRDNERRYLKLGMKAADELLNLADALRLYSAMQRDQVTLDSTTVDLGALAREQLQAALGPKGVSIEAAVGPASEVRALGDEGYLRVALSNLARYLATHLQEPDQPARAEIAVRQGIDERGSVALHVAPKGCEVSYDIGASEAAEHDDLAVLNSLRLIELMGGSARVEPSGPVLLITLPAAEPASAP
jgi:signal transduction histidine kinase